jgi:hypothetical protein
MKNSVSSDVTPCSPLKVNRCCSASHVLQAYYLLGLLFNSKDENDMVLKNVSWILTDYNAFCRRRRNSSCYLLLPWIPEVKYWNIQTGSFRLVVLRRFFPKPKCTPKMKLRIAYGNLMNINWVIYQFITDHLEVPQWSFDALKCWQAIQPQADCFV